MAYKFAKVDERPRLRYDPSKIKILGYWCMIKKDQAPTEKKLESGIFTPTVAHEPKKSGVVVARGDRFSEEVDKVQVGDHIQYAGFVRCCFGWDADTYEVIDSEDIIGIAAKGENHDARGKESCGCSVGGEKRGECADGRCGKPA